LKSGVIHKKAGHSQCGSWSADPEILKIEIRRGVDYKSLDIAYFLMKTEGSGINNRQEPLVSSIKKLAYYLVIELSGPSGY
jgi:hypothetical protein